MDTNSSTMAVTFLPRQEAFALNPHATSYVPLSKRLDHADMDDLLFANKPTTQQLTFTSEVVYKQIRDDDDMDMEMEMDMDIEYLLVTFSGLSKESITDVYLANSGDLEATIEMLNQLEIYSTEAQENLPETLDIEDICESVAALSSSVITNAPVSA